MFAPGVTSSRRNVSALAAAAASMPSMAVWLTSTAARDSSCVGAPAQQQWQRTAQRQQDNDMCCQRCMQVALSHKSTSTSTSTSRVPHTQPRSPPGGQTLDEVRLEELHHLEPPSLHPTTTPTPAATQSTPSSPHPSKHQHPSGAAQLCTPSTTPTPTAAKQPPQKTHTPPDTHLRRVP